MYIIKVILCTYVHNKGNIMYLWRSADIDVLQRLKLQAYAAAPLCVLLINNAIFCSCITLIHVINMYHSVMYCHVITYVIVI